MWVVFLPLSNGRQEQPAWGGGQREQDPRGGVGTYALGAPDHFAAMAPTDRNRKSDSDESTREA